MALAGMRAMAFIAFFLIQDTTFGNTLMPCGSTLEHLYLFLPPLASPWLQRCDTLHFYSALYFQVLKEV